MLIILSGGNVNDSYFLYTFLHHFIFIYLFILNIFYFFNVVSILFIYLFLLHWVFVAVRGLFSSCGEWRLHFVVEHRL